jgi:hypothetical protein
VNTFLGDLQLSALGDLDGLHRLVARALGNGLDLVDHLVALENFAEDNVAAIEPAGDDSGDKKLGAVRGTTSAGISARRYEGRLAHSCLCLSWPCSRGLCGCA